MDNKMMSTRFALRALAAACAATLIWAGLALANGGPFVVKYPEGDPAAKGILARLDPDLRPAEETRLRVVEENLDVVFTRDVMNDAENASPPVVGVSAEYVIQNPTGEEIAVDFGFPILRGIYLEPFSMMPRPDVDVRLGTQRVETHIISNSAIYGIIRQRARETVDAAVAADQRLARLVEDVRPAGPADSSAPGVAQTVEKIGSTGKVVLAPAAARRALAAYLTGTLGWDERDAALMVEYAALDFGEKRSHPPDRAFSFWMGRDEAWKLIEANLGPLSAIGEQKATQFFARLASCFDPEAGATYEGIFEAWGGDVRERSVDLSTGSVRPRQISVSPDLASEMRSRAHSGDPTIYARVDYLDPNAPISEAERASCRSVLKNLPVIFTFAPMNLLHYRAVFPASSTQTLTVSYRQYAFADTGRPASFQLAYLVHPASLWRSFGPIHLEVAVPRGVPFRASVPTRMEGTEKRDLTPYGFGADRDLSVPFAIHRATLDEKRGEILLAVDAGAWKAIARGERPGTKAMASAAGRIVP